MTKEEKEQWDTFMKIWVIPALKNTWGEEKCKEIVEALEEWEEQEPVYFPPCVDCNTKMNEIREAYDKLKNQEPWIPVSEELPEGLMIKTLVSCENDDGLPVCTMIAVYDGFKQKWDCDYRVKAWMPLPAPYKTESEE